jgi:multidrug resistance protein MdtO
MANAAASPSDSQGFFPWFCSFLKEELSPYPGRGMVVARMVIAATVTMILMDTFRITGAFEGALYAFMVSRENVRATVKNGICIAVAYVIGVAFVIGGASLFASHPSARFIWFATSMFVMFFGMRVLKEFAVAVGFTVLLVLALPIWQMPLSAERRVELTLWQALACVLGTLVTVLTEVAFHSFRGKGLFSQGVDDRLSAVQGLVEGYAEAQPIPEDVTNRLVKYTMVGVSGLRRMLTRSHHGRLDRDQLTTVVTLTGRLVDLAATSAKNPHRLLDGDRERLRRLAAKILTIRTSLDEDKIPQFELEAAIAHSGIPLLPEMERTADLIPSVFSGSASIEAFFPSILDREEESGIFFKSDAFRNPEYIRYALQGCLATTLCYFTYEMLAWRTISTCITTCVLTALSNVGTSRQKQTLRITGALAGAFVFGIGAQVFLLPYIDGIGGFSLLFAAITAVAAWFATSSQRLSYFGLQIANAYYLIVLQDFAFQPSLGIARDRVVGILLGLGSMWLVFHSSSKDLAAEHMVTSFGATLRGIAELALLPGDQSGNQSGYQSSAGTTKRIPALRTEIGNNLQSVMANYDAVPFEFGEKRKRDMASRDVVRGWQPQLQTIYLVEVALMQHRVFGAEEHLPPAVPAAQRRFDEACSALLLQMADHLDGKLDEITPELDAPLRDLTQTLEGSSVDHAGLAAARGIEKMSKRIADQLIELSREISRHSISLVPSFSTTT